MKRKWICLLVCVGICIGYTGCVPRIELPSVPTPVAGAGSAAGPQAATPPVNAQETAEHTPAPTFTPAPTPEVIAALCILDAEKEKMPVFAAAAEEMAFKYDWQLNIVGVPQGFDAALAESKHDIILALRTQVKTSLAALEAAAGKGAAVGLLDLAGGANQAIAGISRASYTQVEAADLARLVLNETLQYPPHDTPVRLVALLSEESAPAAVAFQEAVSQGKIFTRGLHYESNKKQSAEAFLNDQLDNWIVGMLDAIYVENSQLAQTALKVLGERKRDDVEVFCIPSGTEGLPPMIETQQELYKRYVFPLAVGVDVEAEFMRMAEVLQHMYKHEDEPETWEFSIVVKHMQSEMPQVKKVS